MHTLSLNTKRVVPFASKAQRLPGLDHATAEGERLRKFVIEAMPGMVSYWGTDLRCRSANKACVDWFGKRPEGLVGATIEEMLGPRAFTLNKAQIREVLSRMPARFEGVLTKVDGTGGHVLAHYVPDVDANGVAIGFFLLMTDVTPFKEAEAEPELVASIFQNSTEGIFVTDSDGIIRSVNPAFTDITGYCAEEAIGRTPRILRSNHHDRAFYGALWREIISNGQWKGEIWNRRKSGELFLAWETIARISDADGAPASYVTLFHDVTDAWRRDEHVRHLAFHDALTGLPNRALLSERLNRQIAMAARERREIAVMFMDLDGFKSVNDRFGHAVGDDLLKTVGRKVQALVRNTDTVARLSGDEFVIQLSNPENRTEVGHVADRILATINEPMRIQGKAIRIGASIGIAIFPDDARTSAELIDIADAAMYAAKQASKNSYRFVDTLIAARNVPR